MKRLRLMDESPQSHHCAKFTNDITIISSFIKTPSVQQQQHETKSELAEKTKNWIKIVTKIKNPKVIYINDDNGIFKNKTVMDSMDNTINVRPVRLNETWAFKLQPYVAETVFKAIYANQLQDNDHIKQNLASYLKYEFIYNTVKQNPFCTQYFGWMETDLFTQQISKYEKVKDFEVYIPSDLDSTRVSFYQQQPKENLTRDEILIGNKRWLCEDIIVGDYSHMASFTLNFMKRVVRYLDKGLTSTSGSIIYAMYMHDMEEKSTKLQVYEPNDTSQINDLCSKLGVLLMESGVAKATKKQL